MRHLLWTRLGVKGAIQPRSVSLQTIYTRLNVSHDSTKSTASKYVRNCERSL